MLSFVIKIAFDVIKTELLAIGITILGLTVDWAKNIIVKLDAIEISDIFKSIFRLINFLCFFL